MILCFVFLFKIYLHDFQDSKYNNIIKRGFKLSYFYITSSFSI
jgi:hypothetical protein